MNELSFIRAENTQNSISQESFILFPKTNDGKFDIGILLTYEKQPFMSGILVANAKLASRWEMGFFKVLTWMMKNDHDFSLMFLQV